ncbi:MAG: hypothetical protein JWM47_1451 [Acidimicrobiales bacterium]|nr:hypothetical protein [Acidimicrobiales bacterium]
MSERYVVLGLAHVRSSWFTDVARWSTAGSIPVEFVKCLTLEELHARIASGRPFSAALLDARLPAVDRDLLATVHDAGIPGLVVTTAPTARDWASLGAVATAPDPLGREILVEVLAHHGRPIDAIDGDVRPTAPEPRGAAWRGRLVAITGPPGAGTSTVAIGVAQHLADDPRYAGDVVLADLARRAHQALLHDARDVVPGLQELVEAHRTGRLGGDELHRLAFDVPVRGYRLILGLRQPRDWVTIRSRAFAAGLDGLRRSSRVVVADADGDLEGEAETGSCDVEDRNLMARAATAEADVVVLVATPTTTGLHGLVHQLEALHRHGVPGRRTLVVVNRAPRAPRARAEVTRIVAALSGAADRSDPYVGPVFVSARRGVDRLHQDVARFPGSVAEPPGRAVRELLDRLPLASRSLVATGPRAVVPGSLGHWLPDDEGAGS